MAGRPKQRRLRINKRANTQYLHVRFMTANIGSMTGKSREIADIMHRRKIMIACVQETKWKGSKAKEIGGNCQTLLPWHMPSQEWNRDHLE